MINRPHFDGPISFQCDGCPEVAETHCTDFPSALVKAKSCAWTVRKRGDEWEHLCPECGR